MMHKMTKTTLFKNDSLSASRKPLNGYSVAHWHDFYEIEYVISGSGVCHVNGQPFDFEEGMLFFMTPADFHSVEAKDADIINIMFLPELASASNLTPFTSLSMPKVISISEERKPFLIALMEEIVLHQKKLTYCASLIDCLLIHIQQNLTFFSERNWDHISQQMHFYIINHFREDISLEDLAAHVGLTPSYTSAVFKQEMQLNYKSYLNNLRFDYARKLLLYSDMTVAQICQDSGFTDYPNFLRRFKEHFGVTPTQLREKQ